LAEEGGKEQRKLKNCTLELTS